MPARQRDPIRAGPLITLILLTAPLAGCLGDARPADGEAASDPGAGPTVIPATMVFSSCRQFGVDFFADPAEVRPLLPPGLEPSGLLGDGATDATIAAYHPICHATVDGTPVGEVNEFWLFALLEPPGTGAHPEAYHAYHLGILTSSPETAATYRAWGIPRVHEETASSQATGPGGAGPFTMIADTANLRLEAEGTLAPTPETALSGQHNRFMMAEPNGTITGVLDVVFGAYAVPAAGEADVSLVIDGEQVRTRAYPGLACGCGDGDWTWTMEYTPLAVLEERSLDAHPTWYVGEWWRVEVYGPYGPEYEATVVVAGEQDGHIMLGMPAEDFNDVAVAIFHIPPIGPMRATDLAYYNHDAPLVMAPFPLEQGKEWTFEWREEETHGKVVDVDGDQAFIELTHPLVEIDLTYDARMGTVTEISQYLNPSSVRVNPASLNVGELSILDHGFGYEGEVLVPDDLHLAIFEQQLAGVVGSPRSVDVEVGPSRDTMSLAIALGEMTDPPGTGSYRAAVTAPNGTTYEYTHGPTDGEAAVQHGIHVKDPGGTWSLELESYGSGGALIEAKAYNATTYHLGSQETTRTMETTAASSGGHYWGFDQTLRPVPMEGSA